VTHCTSFGQNASRRGGKLSDLEGNRTIPSAYKVVRKKLISAGAGSPQDPAALANIVSELFLSQHTLWQPAVDPPASDFPFITTCEVVEAAKRIRPNKAPGIDGIPGVIVKAAATARPEVFSMASERGKVRSTLSKP